MVEGNNLLLDEFASYMHHGAVILTVELPVFLKRVFVCSTVCVNVSGGCSRIQNQSLFKYYK